MIQYYISNNYRYDANTKYNKSYWMIGLGQRFLFIRKEIKASNSWQYGEYSEHHARFDVYGERKTRITSENMDLVKVGDGVVYLEKPYIDYTARERYKIRKCITKYFAKQNLTVGNLGMSNNMETLEEMREKYFAKKSDLKQHIYQ